MKTLKKTRQKKAIKRFETLKLNELMRIRGGEGAPTQIDIDFPK